MRYCGLIGYFLEEEVAPGVWEKHYVFKKYYGDILNVNMNNQNNSESINDKIRIKHEISVVADPYASEHYDKIVCAEIKMGHGSDAPFWKVETVKFQPPRLVLSLSNVYEIQEEEIKQAINNARGGSNEKS